jgi:hypothetical protein
MILLPIFYIFSISYQSQCNDMVIIINIHVTFKQHIVVLAVLVVMTHTIASPSGSLPLLERCIRSYIPTTSNC